MQLVKLNFFVFFL